MPWGNRSLIPPCAMALLSAYILFVWVLTCATRFDFRARYADLLAFLRIFEVPERNEPWFDTRSPGSGMGRIWAEWFSWEGHRMSKVRQQAANVPGADSTPISRRAASYPYSSVHGEPFGCARQPYSQAILIRIIHSVIFTETVTKFNALSGLHFPAVRLKASSMLGQAALA